MGRVYRAFDETLHEKVAIKTLLPEFSRDAGFLSRFREEVRLARRVAHPNVCRVHDYVDHAGTPFLSMEWVEGETLAGRLRRLGPRPETELSVVRNDVTEALRALWSNGIVHRDLKPANLMWTMPGRVKVMDLGLARALRGSGARDQTSGVIGSPEYLSPEQIRGEPATEKSDAYALGVTLFELAAGHPPFRGDSPAQTLLKHLSEAPDLVALAPLSEDLRSTIVRLLEKNSKLRPDLRERTTGALGASTKISPAAIGRPARTAVWAVSLVAAVGLIGSAVYFSSPAPSAPGQSPPPSPSAVASLPLSSPSPSVTATVQSEPLPKPSRTPTISQSSQPSVGGKTSTDPTPVIHEEAGRTTPPLAVPSPTAAPTASPVPTPIPNSSQPTPLTTAPAAALVPTPALPSQGQLIVVVVPWAEVFVDGDRKGLTPLPALILPSGSHVVELRHPDYRPFPRTIEIKAGEQVRLSVNLRLEGIRR